jgi:hypothetical protein
MCSTSVFLIFAFVNIKALNKSFIKSNQSSSQVLRCLFNFDPIALFTREILRLIKESYQKKMIQAEVFDQLIDFFFTLLFQLQNIEVINIGVKIILTRGGFHESWAQGVKRRAHQKVESKAQMDDAKLE